MRLVIALPSNEDAGSSVLRHHMLRCVSHLEVPHHNTDAVACAPNTLSQSVDAMVGLCATTKPHDVAVVAGARLFLTLVLSVPPAVRPARFVVFLGVGDVDDPPDTVRVRRRLFRCVCRAAPQPPVVDPVVVLPAHSSVSILVVDTTGGDARLSAWWQKLRLATRHVALYEWTSRLGGGETEAAASRDGARMLDFVTMVTT